MVEQLTLNQRVGGSSPPRLTTIVFFGISSPSPTAPKLEFITIRFFLSFLLLELREILIVFVSIRISIRKSLLYREPEQTLFLASIGAELREG